MEAAFGGHTIRTDQPRTAGGEDRLECPCHERYSARDGRVLQASPQRPR